MPHRDVIGRLRERLRAADYSVDGVVERLGAEATAALGRNTTITADRALGADADPQATLIRLFALQQTVSTALATAALGPLDALSDFIAVAADGVRARLDVRPYAVEGLVDGWAVSDLLTTLDGRNDPPRPDFVLGISPASTTLAQLAIPGRVGRVLDLGTGCGVQALHVAGRAAHVVGTDVNPRALRLAALTAQLNDIAVDLREGSLYQPVDGERFDLILTNPPYVMSPPDGERLVYREGSFAGDELMRQVVTGAPAHLTEGGVLQVLGNWAITADQPWTERVASWIAPGGCDALVLQREQLDPSEYVEIWLADAGLQGSPEYGRRYREWLDYFDHLGIVGVGLGWLALYNTGRERPDLRLEEWPHAVHQPVGAAFADHPRAVAAAALTDEELLASHWRLASGISQETIGEPGAEDPEHLVLRSERGFGRAHRLETAPAAVIGACDGELPLGVLVTAVAELLDEEAEALRDTILPTVRRVIADGMLQQAEPQ